VRQSEAFEMIFWLGKAYVTSTRNGEKGRLAAAKGLFVDFIGQGPLVPCARSRLEAKPCPFKIHLFAFLVARRTQGKAMEEVSCITRTSEVRHRGMCTSICLIGTSSLRADVTNTVTSHAGMTPGIYSPDLLKMRSIPWHAKCSATRPILAVLLNV